MLDAGITGCNAAYHSSRSEWTPTEAPDDSPGAQPVVTSEGAMRSVLFRFFLGDGSCLKDLTCS